MKVNLRFLKPATFLPFLILALMTQHYFPPGTQAEQLATSQTEATFVVG